MTDLTLRALHDDLCRRLRDIGVEHRPWPGRDDGFAALLFDGRELGHFHHWSELDLRLGKDVIAKEKLVKMAGSTVHPDRAANSPWHEMRVKLPSDVDEAVRLVRLAIAARKK
ncbi:MAG TPA: luciferase family protein [Steroidobacteraceae bacterium]